MQTALEQCTRTTLFATRAKLCARHSTKSSVELSSCIPYCTLRLLGPAKKAQHLSRCAKQLFIRRTWNDLLP
jgi:hypothetical protein